MRETRRMSSPFLPINEENSLHLPHQILPRIFFIHLSVLSTLLLLLMI